MGRVCGALRPVPTMALVLLSRAFSIICSHSEHGTVSDATLVAELSDATLVAKLSDALWSA